MPDDELSLPRRFENDRLAVARLFFFRGERAPDFLAGELVESHHFGVAGPAHNGDQAIPIHHWSAGHTPGRRLRVIVLDVILLPDDLASPGFQAYQGAFGALNVHVIAFDGRRCARADRVRLHQADVVDIPLLRPQNPACLFVQTNGAFGSLRIDAANEIGDVDSTAGDGGPGVARVDRSAPFDGEALSGKFVENAGFRPYTQAASAAPLGPVISHERRAR